MSSLKKKRRCSWKKFSTYQNQVTGHLVTAALQWIDGGTKVILVWCLRSSIPCQTLKGAWGSFVCSSEAAIFKSCPGRPTFAYDIMMVEFRSNLISERGARGFRSWQYCKGDAWLYWCQCSYTWLRVNSERFKCMSESKQQTCTWRWA